MKKMVFPMLLTATLILGACDKTSTPESAKTQVDQQASAPIATSRMASSKIGRAIFQRKPRSANTRNMMALQHDITSNSLVEPCQSAAYPGESRLSAADCA